MKRVVLPLISGLTFFLASCGSTSRSQEVVFRAAMAADITSTNPHLMEDNSSFNICYNTFEGLFRMNKQTAQAEPALVEGYTLSEDGLTYTFFLKEGLVFSDHSPITAQTVLDSWVHALDPVTASPTSYILAEILSNGKEVNTGKLPLEELGVKAINEKTLEVRLSFPAPYAKEIFTLPVAAAIPTHLIKLKGENWNKTYPIVSSGAFVLDSWKPNSQIVLKKNLQYYDAKNVHLDTLIFYVLDDTNTAYNMYLNHEIDFLSVISPDKIEEAQHREDYHSDPFTNSYFYVFNMKRKPLDDIRVRQALAKAIDRKTLTDKILKGGERPLYSVIYDMPNYPSKEYLKESVSEARALLAEAGFPEGRGFPRLSLLYNTLEIHKKVAEFVQQQWKQNLGIEVTLQNQEWKSLFSKRSNFDYDVLRMGWLPDYPDPASMLAFFLSTAGYSNYNNTEYDSLLESSNLVVDQVNRMLSLACAEEKVMKDLPFIPILSQSKNTLFDTGKWEGIYNNPANIVIFRDVKPKEQ